MREYGSLPVCNADDHKRVRIAVEQKDLFFCTFTEPRGFGSKLDEDAYFRWIQEIPGVISIEELPSAAPLARGPARLRVGVNMSQFDKFSLMELLALYYRFGLNFEELKIFINDSNRQWVCDPKTFWARRLATAMRKSS